MTGNEQKWCNWVVSDILLHVIIVVESALSHNNVTLQSLGLTKVITHCKLCMQLVDFTEIAFPYISPERNWNCNLFPTDRLDRQREIWCNPFNPFPHVQVNIDHQTSKEIIEKMKLPNKACFSRAQQSVYLLMARDSFVRFVKSEEFQSALKR